MLVNKKGDNKVKRTKFGAVRCRLCGGKFLRITNTHLWKHHGITMEEYKQKFPNAPINAKCGYETTEEHRENLRNVQTVHGGHNYRKRALEYYGLECARCGKTTENPKDFVVHHKDCSNVSSELTDHSLENLSVLCKTCYAKLHNELNDQASKFVGLSSVEKGVHYIFKGLRDELGLDLTDENFKDTPKRIARAYAEIFSGVKNTQQQVDDILNSAFPAENDQLILVRGIEVFSMCPHHLLPVSYRIHAGYIPSVDEGKVIGISKLSRLAEILSKRPVLQEQLVEDVAKNLMRLPGCLGAACVVEGVHYCMVMRGVNQPHAKTITSSLKGVFLQESGQGPAARNELMRLIE